MPCFVVQVPVTILINITVDAPDEDAAQIVDIASIKPAPIFQTDKGIDADNDAFSINWIGRDGYRWDEADATPCDPTKDAIIIDHDGNIYPTREARDAAIGADEDED